MRFLVVDDSPTMRRIIVNSLERIGYTDAVQVGSGAEALRTFDGTFQFLIVDANLPDLSGLDLLRLLRGNRSHRAVPALVVTTRNSRHDLAASIGAEACHWLVKPFTPRRLQEQIDAVITSLPAPA
jgi:two-component system chemotaxis response regulator CheY